MRSDWTTIRSLSWFFSGAAEADAGVRSGQGGFEDTMQRLALCGRAATGHPSPGGESWVGGDLLVRETRSTASASDDAIERLHRRRQKLADGRMVMARLKELDSRQLAVLELQFGDELWFCEERLLLSQQAVLEHRWGVSLALLCCTTRVVKATEGVNGRRKKRGAKPVNPREAVVALLGRGDAESRLVIADMAAEAEHAVEDALRAYEVGHGGH